VFLRGHGSGLPSARIDEDVTDAATGCVAVRDPVTGAVAVDVFPAAVRAVDEREVEPWIVGVRFATLDNNVR